MRIFICEENKAHVLVTLFIAVLTLLITHLDNTQHATRGAKAGQLTASACRSIFLQQKAQTKIERRSA